MRRIEAGTFWSAPAMRLFGMESLSQADLLMLLFVVTISSVVLGYLSDAIMGASGFGPIGNGLLIGLGGVVGVHYRTLVFGPVHSQQHYIIAFSAVGAATVLLLAFGLLKKVARR